MPRQAFHVRADWDDDAQVWVAVGEDVPGLATEAPTIEALMAKLEVMVPELLELNGVVPGGGEVSLNLQAYRDAKISAAAWPLPGRRCPDCGEDEMVREREPCYHTNGDYGWRCSICGSHKAGGADENSELFPF